MARRWLDPESASDLGQLDAEAIARVRAEAWPDPTNADELHDALVWLGFLAESEAGAGWDAWFAELRAATAGGVVSHPGSVLWIAAERLPHSGALFPEARIEPDIAAPEGEAREWSPEEALVEVVRGRLEGLGPVTATAIAHTLGVEVAAIEAALVVLEAEGFAMRGRFTLGIDEEEWCERRLLARIHRYTVKRLRAEIEPVAAKDFMRFLLDWQRVTGDTRMDGIDALGEIVTQLEGFEAPAGAWESEILAARLSRLRAGLAR